MDIESAIVTLLQQSAALTTLVSGRIYPMILPDDGTYPAVSYQRISETPDYTLDGPGTFNQVRIQFDCWAMDFASCRAMADAIKASIDGLTAVITGFTIWNAMRDNSQDFFEPDHRLYRNSVDYIVQFAITA